MSEFSVKRDRENLPAFLNKLPGDTLIASLTTEHLESQVFDPMRKQGLAPRTINGRIKTLRQVLKLAVSQGYAPFNVALGLQRMVEPQDGIPALSEQRINALLNPCDLSKFTGLRDYTMIALMLDSGIRLREMTDLKVSQVDLRNQLLRNVFGKNRKVEDIAVSAQVCDVLERYVDQRNRGQVTTDIFFVTISGTALKRSTIQKIVKYYGNMVGITDVRVSPHTFRHTLAKHWIPNGGDLPSLKRIIRHKNIAMLEVFDEV